MKKRSQTSMSISLLWQLFKEGQLNLAPEFQRNSIWPRAAKAYLIDTILNDKPIPPLLFQRITSAQTGKPEYAVIDGQQRLRAIFEFFEGRVALTESKSTAYKNKTILNLAKRYRNQILNYDLRVEEIAGYSERDIRDMFTRMNKYVVKLAPQELRHAQFRGEFHNFAEELGRFPFWRRERVFSPHQIKRMRPTEFAAELTILLIEGPQDKKAPINLYYAQFEKSFPYRKSVKSRLTQYLNWIKKSLPELRRSRYRRPVDLYALIGALDNVSRGGKHLARLRPNPLGDRLRDFEAKTRAQQLTGDAARYVVAASRQTDNITPRTTRIEVLERVLKSSR